MIYLVGCGAAKRSEASPARELYTSNLFRMSAELAGDGWAIVSALHGLVMPEQKLEPYEYRLRTRIGRVHLGERVATALRARWPEEKVITALMGADYARAIREAAPDLEIREPMKGLGIGTRMFWLRHEIDHHRRRAC